MQVRCEECKGKGLCGLERCPVMSRMKAMQSVRPVDGYMGAAPSVFIGSWGYPRLSGGPLMSAETDLPTEWIARGLGIDEIVGIRSRTIRGTSRGDRALDRIREIAISSRPLDIEVAFEKPVRFAPIFGDTVTPVGMSGRIAALEVLDNPLVEPAVDRVTSDTDLPAAEAASALHLSAIDVYRISQLLTGGLMGRKRRMVPTRWAITAVDDMVSKGLKGRIGRYAPLPSIRILHASLHANQIVCLLIPGPWKFEMIEVWRRGSLWSQGAETIMRDGEGMVKSGYSPIAGAYYSARLAVAEYLDRIRRSAAVVVIRAVGSDYWAPLGTWVIREAARAACNAPPVPCDTLEEVVTRASSILGFSHWLEHSRLIPEIRTQKRLFDF